MSEARRKILCIDDDREVAALIVDDLTNRGVDVVVAYDGH